MAFIRNCFATVAMLVSIAAGKAQTVYYPPLSSQVLKATVTDVASLLQQAIPGAHFTTASYTVLPSTGIIFRYDSSIAGNQACRVQSNGSSYIIFSAAEDNGLTYGVYQYLQEKGFRFYQPGTIWEQIPVLSGAYAHTDTTYQPAYKYKSWAISGGCNRWIMDNQDFSWDMYNGVNGHNWAQYQRRNGMLGEYRFAGHRGDIMSASYLSTLRNNPCYVACYNGSRTAYPQSVPDIHNEQALQLWAGSIETDYSQTRTAIYNNKELYTNYYRSFNYYRGLIGIEVPDGALWGNSTDHSSCSAGDYPEESDQQFTLANYTAGKISRDIAGKRFQVYAYSSHANTPSAGITIGDNIDVQVVPTAFQNESSVKGLLNRWYNKTNNVSEYHYMNIPQWGGETPLMSISDLQQTLQRLKEKKSQGITWEASPAKFASLPLLWAANRNMISGIPVDSSLQEFCRNMFGTAAPPVYRLLRTWGDAGIFTAGNYIQDNKFKLPLYLGLVKEADRLAQNESSLVKQRLLELKAYLHYVVLYYSWAFDQRSISARRDKAAAICLYLARSNRLQLVNSYFLILDMVSRFPSTDIFYQQYNITNGTAYQNGNLAALTDEEITANFNNDLALPENSISSYSFTAPSVIKDQLLANNLQPQETIVVKMSYTAGFNNPCRSGYYIEAPRAGTFTVNYTPQFNLAGRGYINFTVEAVNSASAVLADISVNRSGQPGSFTIHLPAAGTYLFSVTTKFQSAVALQISTNGNYFYKNTPYTGAVTETYTGGLPGYFYVPAGISRIYFSTNNSGPGGSGYATAEQLSKAFVIKDNSGSALLPRLVTPNDSAFFYLDVPYGSSGKFWQIQQIPQYHLCFANISNDFWLAQPGSCTGMAFTASVVKSNGSCVTQLTTAASTGNLIWEVNEGGKQSRYLNKTTLQLPSALSPDAVVTLFSGNCQLSKRLGDDGQYTKALESCSGKTETPGEAAVPVVFPNPSNGIFFCQENKKPVQVNQLQVLDLQGREVAGFSNVSQFNISHLPAGLYVFRMLVNGTETRGRLVKH